MLQAVWFNAAGQSRLLLVIHHLAVDGVSWRILVPDLAAAFMPPRCRRGGRRSLEPVGTPFRVWAQHLAEQAPIHRSACDELPVLVQSMLGEGGALVPLGWNCLIHNTTRWAMRSI